MTAVSIAIPEKLIPIFDGPADVRGAKGGRGSGKTRTFATMIAIKGYIFGKSGISGTLLCSRYFQNSIADSSLEECKRAIEEYAFLTDYYEIGENYIRSKDGRISFAFMGLARKVNSIKSMGRILICWIDEAEPITDDVYVTLIPTLREEGSGWNAELWLTWNPESEHSATHKRFSFESNPLVKIAVVNWADNPKFPQKLERQRLTDLEQRPELYDHIWEGAFNTNVTGAVYGKEMRAITNEDRFRIVPHQPDFPVFTAWDIGRSDATAVWFWQVIAGEIHVIDFICESLRDPDWFASQLLGKRVDINIVYDNIRVKYGDDLPEAAHRKAYKYGKLWLPHDAKAKTFAAKGKSLEELFAAVFGWKLIDRTPTLSVYDGIQAVRKTLPHCYFDISCKFGVDALKAYHYEWDEKLMKLSDKPKHDWASNPADAARYMAIVWQETKPKVEAEKAKFDIDRSFNELVALSTKKRLSKYYD